MNWTQLVQFFPQDKICLMKDHIYNKALSEKKILNNCYLWKYFILEQLHDPL